MKKMKILILSCVLAINLAVPAFAYNNTQDILACMNIMTYTDGDFLGNNYITRGMMSKILVMASPHKDYITTSNISPFYDVPHTHWSAPYVSSATSNDIMGGYSDGSFKPDNYIKTEEAITSVLNLLGYTDFGGTYPSSQMSLAKSLGLLDGTNLSTGNNIKRSDFATIIYNALNTKTKEGATLAQTLGYDTTNLTLNGVLIQEFNDPTIVSTTTTYAGYKIYVDGNSATSVPSNSLVYVNHDSQIVFAYTQKLSGVIADILPNKESPESIIISSKEYQLTTDVAKSKVSLDGYNIGDYVTAALDRNGQIGDLLDSFVQNTTVGVLIESGVNSAYGGNYIKLVLPSGAIFEYPSEKDYSSSVGDVFEISNTGDISRTSYNSNVSGKFDSTKLTLNNDDISQNISIIDVNENGETITISKDRMNNVSLSNDDILYAEFNENGEITALILNDVTGDLYDYGYLIDVDVKESDTLSSTTYEYDLNGTTQTKNYSHINQGIKTGPVKIYLNSINEYSFSNLSLIDEKISSVNKNQLTFENGQKHTISDSVVVYKETASTPVVVDINDIDLFDAEFYYDSTQSNGGAIRIIYIK